MQIKIYEEGTTVTASITGRFDTAAALQYATEVEQLIDHSDKDIVIDCGALEFVSSSGLRLFLKIRKATIANGGSVTMRNVNDNVKQVFSLTGFYSLFNFE